MKFKDAKMWDQLKQCPIFLELLADDLDDFCQRNFNKQIVITRVADPVEGESGVHLDMRAFDVRNETSDGFYFEPKEIEDILTYINSKYKRCDGLRTCIHHSFNGGPKHLHLQLALSMDAYRRRPE